MAAHVHPIICSARRLCMIAWVPCTCWVLEAAVDDVTELLLLEFNAVVYLQLLPRIQTQALNSFLAAVVREEEDLLLALHCKVFALLHHFHTSPLKPVSLSQTSQSCVSVISQDHIVSHRVLLHLLLSTFTVLLQFSQAEHYSTRVCHAQALSRPQFRATPTCDCVWNNRVLWWCCVSVCNSVVVIVYLTCTQQIHCSAHSCATCTCIVYSVSA